DPTAPRNTAFRRWEALVVSYLQRYCAKNDTIGFFGPVGWARVEDGHPGAITIRPGPDLLASRDVYLENWAVHELAQTITTDELRPWVAPRRMPFIDEADGQLHIPLTPPVALSPLRAAVLRGCDGVRTAHELAAELVADPTLDCADPEQVYRELAELHRQRRIAWSLEVPPSELVPQRALRRQLDAIGDKALAAPAEAALSELEAARAEVASAAGDPDRLVATIGALQETFTRLTGVDPVRRPGLFYAGRTLVHEECRRDCEVVVSAELLDTLWPSMSLMLESARWFTSAGAALYRRALRDVYRERVAATGSRVLRFADFWLWANDTIFRLDPRLVGRLTRTLQERWAAVLGLREDEPGDVRLESAALREAVSIAFAAPRPGWHSAIQHSPDVMIAATDAEAIRAGEFLWVLGELHAGVNTLRAAVFASQHPHPAELREAMRADLGGPRIVLGETREHGGTPQRLANALAAPDDLRLVFGHDTCGVDPQRAMPVGACLIEEVDGRLMVRSRDGRHQAELVEVLNEPLVGQLVQHFKPLPQGERSSRITIDRLVIRRRSWSMGPAELAFAFADSEPQRYLLAQRWRTEHGLPRYVFTKSPVEHKPVFVDLASVPSVELFAHAIRAMERDDAGHRMGIGEMLPDPDQLWLTDAAGDRYTAEFRIVAVDRRGRNGGSR
ncbi:MAG TPA: lantibiotic dehydratase, partial [Pseudonocardiaceae bacterium]|nr:lantibiotic dehydratase [Pseudonocardiaceae bacterium]